MFDFMNGALRLTERPGRPMHDDDVAQVDRDSVAALDWQLHLLVLIAEADVYAMKCKDCDRRSQGCETRTQFANCSHEGKCKFAKDESRRRSSHPTFRMQANVCSSQNLLVKTCSRVLVDAYRTYRSYRKYEKSLDG